MTDPLLRTFKRFALVLLAVALILSAGCAHPNQKSSNQKDQSGPESSDSLSVQLVAFNDFHGYLSPPKGKVKLESGAVRAGGIAQLKAYVDRIKKESAHSLVVSSGDLVGASPLQSAIFHDEPTIEAFNQLGLAYSAVGNHEFDEGVPELERLQNGGCHPEDGCQFAESFEGAKFQYLAANVVDKKTGETLFPPYATHTVDGVKIGFIGVVAEDTPDIVVPGKVDPVRFLDQAEVINKYSRELTDKNVEAIVVLIHDGGVPKKETKDINDCGEVRGTINDIARETSDAVDLFISGHTHRTYICRMNGKLVTSAMSYGRLVTNIDLRVDRKTKDIEKMSAKNIVIRADGASDGAFNQFVRRVEALSAERANKKIAAIKQPLSARPDKSGESDFGRVIADAQLAATRPPADQADIALMNTGGIRAPLRFDAPAGSETAPVTYRELYKAQPFGNHLVTMDLTGKQIHDILEAQWSGKDGHHGNILQVSHTLRYTWHADRPPGQRVDPEDVSVKGVKLDLDKTYRVTANNFIAGGGDTFETFTEGTNRKHHGKDIEALVDYLKTHSPIEKPDNDRISRATK